jgi:hypothetical protein
MAAGGAADAEGQLLVTMLLDGLIDRMQRLPLMRRPPAHCSPEEQVELARLLADLAGLRQARAEAGALPPVRMSVCATYWPELAALLAPPRGSRSAAKAKEVVAERETPSLFDVGPAVPDDAAAAEPEPSSVDEGSPESPPSPPASSGAELTGLLVQALSETGRALNTTQMLSWLDAHGIKTTREVVIDTLFRHEDRFRRRGNSQWTVVGQEQPA